MIPRMYVSNLNTYSKIKTVKSLSKNNTKNESPL